MGRPAEPASHILFEPFETGRPLSYHAILCGPDLCYHKKSRSRENQVDMSKNDKKSRVLTVAIIIALGLWAAAIGAYFARNRVKSAPLIVADPPGSAAGKRGEEGW